MCVRILGEPSAEPTSIHRLLAVTALSRTDLSVAYWLYPPSTAMSTTAEPAFSTAVRNSSRYFGSVDGKMGLHGSMLCTLNFSTTCAAKSLSCICCATGTVVRVLPSHPFHPTMYSRNG